MYIRGISTPRVPSDRQEAGAPPSTDCDADTERGRMILDHTNNWLYVCAGVSSGWGTTDPSLPTMRSVTDRRIQSPVRWKSDSRLIVASLL